MASFSAHHPSKAKRALKRSLNCAACQGLLNESWEDRAMHHACLRFELAGFHYCFRRSGVKILACCLDYPPSGEVVQVRHAKPLHAGTKVPQARKYCRKRSKSFNLRSENVSKSSQFALQPIERYLKPVQ